MSEVQTKANAQATAIDAIREFLSVDEWGEDGSEEHMIAFVLLASAFIGPNGTKIAAATGLPKGKVASIASRARRAGIWKAHHIEAEWGDEKCGGVALALDVATVLGLLKRS